MSKRGSCRFGIAFGICTIILAGPLQAAPQFKSDVIQKAIQKGVKYLYSQQKPDGSWKNDSHYPTGHTTLVCYALLASGESAKNAKLAKALDWLTKHKTNRIYTLGLRCSVWKLAAQENPKKFLPELKKDTRLVIKYVSPNGGYGYAIPPGTQDGPHGKNNPVHHSTAQYGVLAAWAGSRACEIPTRYWKLVQKWWLTGQNSDGGWGYHHRLLNKNPNVINSRPSMVTAGIASLFLCFDRLHARDFIGCGKGKLPKSIVAGLKWMDKDTAGSLKNVKRHSRYTYYLYGLERVGLAAGYKYFGKCDWYKDGTMMLLRSQRGNGSWGFNHGLQDTSFCLVFLMRGQHPVLFNKLEFQGDWNNRPRDLANLTEWVSTKFERPVRWQITNLRVPTHELHDSHFLYISAQMALKLKDDEINKIRNYVEQGGTLVSVAECNGKKFKASIRELYAKLWPNYPLTELSSSHELYKAHYRLKGKPAMLIVSNGVRPLAIHTDRDLARSWQTRSSKISKSDYEITVNMVKYVIGSFTDLRSRATWEWPKAQKRSKTLNIVRIQHKNNWNPEPGAFKRFQAALAAKTPFQLNIKTSDLKSIGKTGCKMAVMTGTGKWNPTTDELNALKKWIQGGGTILIDAAGGDTTFYQSARSKLKSLISGAHWQDIPPSAPMFMRKGMQIRNVSFRRKTRRRLRGVKSPQLLSIAVNNRPAILLSQEDITAGLVDYPSGTVDGYSPQSAYELMRNIVLFGTNAK